MFPSSSGAYASGLSPSHNTTNTNPIRFYTRKHMTRTRKLQPIKNVFTQNEGLNVILYESMLSKNGTFRLNYLLINKLNLFLLL